MRVMRVAVGAPMSNNHPNGKSSPEPYQTAASKPTGYTGAHQLVRLVGLVRQVRHKRHAHATRTPPLPSSCLAYPNGNSSPEPNPTAPRKPSGYTMAHPYSSQKFPKIPKDSQKFPYSATPPQTAYPRSHQTGTKKAAWLVPNRSFQKSNQFAAC